MDKIDNHHGLPLNNLLGQGKAQTGGNQATPAAPDSDSAAHPAGSASDRLTIDGATQALRQTEATLQNEAPVDSEKVARLRQAIADGSYKVDSDRVTDSFLAMENSLFKK